MWSELLGRERRKTVRSMWYAVAESVPVRTRNLVLTLQAGGALEGTASLPDGRPADGVWILQAGQRLGTTRGDGSFRFEGLEPGPILLTAGRDDARLRDPMAVEIVSGATTFVGLRLVPIVSLRIVTTRGGEPADAKLTVLDAEGHSIPPASQTRGSVWIGSFLAGWITVIAQSDGKTIERSIEVTGVNKNEEFFMALD